MKKLFLSTLLLLLPLLASAYDFEAKNADDVTIYYNIINEGTELEVTSGNGYSGDINIPEKVTYNGNPLPVTSIGEKAFDDCCDLASVTIPNSVTTIGYAAFYGCSGLTSVTIPKSVTSIGVHAFNACPNLTSVNVERGNTVYDSRNDCNAIIETASNTLFQGFVSTVIPDDVTTIGRNAFYGCRTLTSVTIPNSVTTIGNAAFAGCSGLTSLTIPNSVTSIGNSAFENCTSLTSVIIPNSVSTIGVKAFERCTGLTSVTSRMKDPCSIDQNCFPADVFSNATLNVPKGTKDEYQSTEYWNKFSSIEEFEICATPTIGYGNKKLTFSCDTEGVEYHCTIIDTDIKSYVAGSIDLSATYQISVYATKEGYEDSDEATATLVWMSAQMEGAEPIVTPANAPTESVPVLISSRDGNLTVKSELDGQPVAVYTIDGKALGSAKVKGGQAVIATNLQKGTIVVVKVGDRSVKISI